MNPLTIQEFYSSAYLKLEFWFAYQAPNYDCWQLQKDRIYDQITGMSFVLCCVSDLDAQRLTDIADFVLFANWDFVQSQGIKESPLSITSGLLRHGVVNS